MRGRNSCSSDDRIWRRNGCCKFTPSASSIGEFRRARGRRRPRRRRRWCGCCGCGRRVDGFVLPHTAAAATAAADESGQLARAPALHQRHHAQSAQEQNRCCDGATAAGTAAAGARCSRSDCESMRLSALCAGLRFHPVHVLVAEWRSHTRSASRRSGCTCGCECGCSCRCVGEGSGDLEWAKCSATAAACRQPRTACIVMLRRRQQQGEEQRTSDRWSACTHIRMQH